MTARETGDGIRRQPCKGCGGEKPPGAGKKYCDACSIVATQEVAMRQRLRGRTQSRRQEARPIDEARASIPSTSGECRMTAHIEAVIADFERTANRAEAPDGNLVGYYVDADEWRRIRAVLRASAPEDGLRAALDPRVTDSLGIAEWAADNNGEYARVNPDWLRAIVAEARRVRALLADQPPTLDEGVSP